MYRTYIDMTCGRQLGLSALLSIPMESVMRVMNMVVLGLVSVVVSGCVSNTPKPDMTESQYQYHARLWQQIHACNRQGDISPETASAGVNLYQRLIQPYSVDSGKVDALVRLIPKGNVPKTTCNQLALYIVNNTPKNKPSNDDSSQGVFGLYQPQPMRSTYCTSSGPNTLCNTY